MAKYGAQDRRDLADKGHALPDGSFPIADVEDLKSAIRNWALGKQPQVAKQFIVKRARSLGAMDVIPSKWMASGRFQHSDVEPTVDSEEFLAHFGVKGMKWGRRSAESKARESRDTPKEGKQLFRIPVGGGKSLSYTVHPDAGKRIAKAEAVIGGAAAAAYVGYRAYKKIDQKILLKNTTMLLNNKKAQQMADRMLGDAGRNLPYAKIIKGVQQATSLK